MGTISNTLILAYTGGSINILVDFFHKALYFYNRLIITLYHLFRRRTTIYWNFGDIQEKVS